jgi:hypothetical protein
MEKPFPAIPADLLEALEKAFPERSADLKWSDRQVWFKAGECEVVRFLRAKFTEQNETVIQR